MPTVSHTATRDVITVLIRGWKLIVGCAIAFGLIALAVSLLQKPVYEATVTLYVTSGTNSQGTPPTPYEDVMGGLGRLSSYSRLTYSDKVLARAVKALDLHMTVDQARNAVGSHLVPESLMFTVSARNQDRATAQRFASALADSMIDTVAGLEAPNGGGPPTTRLTVVTPATLNPKPASPTTLMNVTLATFAGVLVAVAAALGRERLNNTVRDERDIEKFVSARPLGSIPHDKTLRAGLTIDFGVPAVAAGAFRRLRTALSVVHSERSLATILVTSPREGDGKSTVALNLAAAFAGSGSTVVLVDADLGNPVAARHTGNGEVPGLIDVIKSEVPPLQLSAMAIDSLKVIGAGRVRDEDPASLLASSACGKFFKQLNQTFDYVIVDSPSLLDGPEAEAVACWADGVLLVARRGKSKISDCYAAVTQLSDLGAELVGVVFNDVCPPRERERPAPPRAVGLRRR
ncbi:Wzz/FepE/Etk N-terminal domain-containing protein [uncultured Mycobacterium sp.]|uniref:Wzz/FepE/Etk N-terminal domain-containing protein n=1 Tax=uncultured Mycobacterium sp. TaxID=171292 RepID=UPI0035CB9140